MKAKRIFFTALSIFAFLIASCSDVSDELKADTQKAYIKIGGSEIARMIFPENIDIFGPAVGPTTFVLTGKADGKEDYEKTWTSYSLLQQDSDDKKIEIEVGTWTFTLTATYKDRENNTVLFSDTIEKKIKTGINELKFKLVESENNLTGSGYLDVTVNYPISSGANKVVAELYKFDEYPDAATPVSSTFTVGAINNTISINPNNSKQYQFIYGNNNIEAGKYVVKFIFYNAPSSGGAEVEIKPGYAESVIIKRQQTSKKTIDLTALDAIRTISYFYVDDQGSTYAIEPGYWTENFEPKQSFVSVLESVKLPTADDILWPAEYDASKNVVISQGRIFEGWYEDENCSGEPVTDGYFDEDLTLYGKFVAPTFDASPNIYLGLKNATTFDAKILVNRENVSDEIYKSITWELKNPSYAGVLTFGKLPATEYGDSNAGTETKVTFSAKANTNGTALILAELNGKILGGITIEIGTSLNELAINALASENEQNSAATKKFTVPSGYTEIALAAFANSNYSDVLETIEIPESVTFIGDNTFSGCANLQYVYMLPKTPPTLGTDAFENCNNLKAIYVPTGGKDDGSGNTQSYQDVYSRTTNWSSYNIQVLLSKAELATIDPNYKTATTIEIPADKYYSVIASDAFSECANLETLTIPSSVQIIEEGAFANCRSLNNVTLGKNYGWLVGDAGAIVMRWDTIDDTGFLTEETPPKLLSSSDIATYLKDTYADVELKTFH